MNVVFLSGKGDIRRAFMKTLAELAGGLLVFKYVQMYWALEISDTHKDRAYEDCRADLQVQRNLYFSRNLSVWFCACILTSLKMKKIWHWFSNMWDLNEAKLSNNFALVWFSGYLLTSMTTCILKSINKALIRLIAYLLKKCSNSK
jgi:hypothetical protein